MCFLKLTVFCVLLLTVFIVLLQNTRINGYSTIKYANSTMIIFFVVFDLTGSAIKKVLPDPTACVPLNNPHISLRFNAHKRNRTGTRSETTHTIHTAPDGVDQAAGSAQVTPVTNFSPKRLHWLLHKKLLVTQ